ncbi:MAG: diguanylate cyclase/phosphodiesterase [Gemmatimonadetes bacterium]|jgi:signal transduction histidine kinase/DNA-binding response OmpR family regulator|nr:diguanylate cyclase/phosphodiesterase [Gemmatimonadota bacterium]
MTSSNGKARILVVEDSATQAAALAELLERSGFETVIARRAERALEILDVESVDLVLSDVVMPGMDGYELTKRIRDMPTLSELPIVLLTSLTDPLAIVRGLECGADHYVTKPYEPASLLARVIAVLERTGEPRLHPKPFTVDLLGTPFTISATKEQILELLVSSYSDLVRTSEAVRDAERRARFLAEATELLSSSLDVHHVLRDLARLVVSRIAEVCAADLLGSGGMTQRVEIAHGFPSILPVDDVVPQTYTAPISAVAQRAVDQSALQLVPLADDEVLTDVARDPALLEQLRLNGPYALLVVPLIARRRVLGFLQFLSADVERLSAPESLLLVEDLARRAALAVDNALLYGEAQRATQARDDVLAIVSHDLRNPLNTIHMSTAFLLDVLQDPDAVAPPLIPQLQLIRRATARGNALIQDLLDVSRIESGTLAVDDKPTSATTLLFDAVLDLEPLVTSKGLRFEHEWKGEDVELSADRGRIAQVFSNLVGNAIKFTPKTGLVRLTGKRNGDHVEFVVSDSGSGIAPDHVPHLFNRFWKATKASRSGAGLGLFIVKGIVESHGGSVSVESEPDKGTTFCFSLPLASKTPGAPIEGVARS